MSKIYTVPQLANIARRQLPDDHPDKDLFNSMSDDEFVSHLLKKNPQLSSKLDYNSLGQGLKSFGQHTKGTVPAALQTVLTMAQAATETIKDPETFADPTSAVLGNYFDEIDKTQKEKKLLAIHRAEEQSNKLQEQHQKVVANASDGSAFDFLESWRVNRRKSAEKAFDEDPYLKAYRHWFSGYRDHNGEEVKGAAQNATFGDMFRPKMIGALVGQGAPTLLMGVGAFAAGNAIAPGVGGALSFTMMYGLESGMQYNEVHEDLLGRGYSETEARKLANLSAIQTGSVNALLENLRLGSMFKKLGIGKYAGKALPKKLLNKAADKVGGLKNLASKIPGNGDNWKKMNDLLLTKIFKQALQEGAEEWAQGVNQRTSELGFNDHTVADIFGGAETPAFVDFMGGFYGGMGISTPLGLHGAGLIPYTENRAKRKAIKEINAIIDPEKFDKVLNNSFESGQTVAQNVSDEVIGGNQLMDWEDYVKTMWQGDAEGEMVGYIFPDWLKKPDEGASDAAKQSYEDGKANRGAPARTLAAMKRSGLGRSLLDAIGDNKADAEGEVRHLLTQMFPQLKEQQKDNPALLDEIIDDYIEGGTILRNLKAEKEVEGSILGQAGSIETSTLKYAMQIKNPDLRDRVIKAAVGNVNVKIADVEDQLELGQITDDEAQSQMSMLQLEKQVVSDVVLSAEAVAEDVETQVEQKILDEAEGNIDVESMVLKSIENQMIKTEKGKQAGKQKEELRKRIRSGKATPDDVATLRGLIAGFAVKGLDALSEQIENTNASGLKVYMEAFKMVKDFDNDDRYPRNKNGTISFSGKNKKIVAGLLAEDIFGALGKKTSQVSEKEQSKNEEISEPSQPDLPRIDDPSDFDGMPDKQDIKQEKGLNAVDRIKNKLRSKGKTIIGSGSSEELNPLKEKFGDWSGVAYMAAASTTKSSFYKNLKKLGFSEDQVNIIRASVKNALGGFDAFQANSRRAAKGLRKKPTVSSIFKDYSETLINNISGTIKNIQDSTGDSFSGVRLAESDDAWRLVSPQFDEAWEKYFNSQSQRTKDPYFAFQQFVRGMLNGIRASDYVRKKQVARWFTQWAKNNKYGQDDNGLQRTHLFHDKTIGKRVASIFNPTRKFMQDESSVYGTNIIKTFEQTDREGLDQLEGDVVDDVNDYRDFAEESIHVVSSNIKTVVETSTGKDVTIEDMEKIQIAAFESVSVEDFIGFLEKEYNVPVDILETRPANRILNYWNTMQNRIPRGEKMYFVLSNVNDENEMEDGTYHLRLKKQDWKNRRKLSGFMAKSFLDEIELGDRTAYLYASDILQVYKLKKSQGALFDEDGLAHEDKIFAKENVNDLTLQKIYQINHDLGNNFEGFGADAPMFIVGMKGGNSRALVIANATDEDIERGLDAELLEEYLKEELEKGYITEEHIQNLRDYAEKAVESNPYVWIQLIGRHEYWKQAFHNRYLLDAFTDPITNKEIPNKNYVEWMFNRMRLVLAEGNIAKGMGDTTIITVDAKDTDMYYQGKKLETWADYLNEAMERYGFDGAIFTSESNIQKKELALGMDAGTGLHSGWIKSVITHWADDGDSFLGVKGLEMAVPEGMEFRTKDGEVIAKAIKDIDGIINLVDNNGNYIDQLLSTEEQKIGVGRYSSLNTPLTLPEEATRILQVPGELSKNSGATPTQWLDLMLDPQMLSDNPSAAKAYGIMRKHLMDVEKQYLGQLDKMAQFPGLIGDYLKKLKGKKTLKDSEIDKFLNILEGDELGLFSHNFFVEMFEPMLKNRMLVDGAFKGRKTNFSSYLHIRPNFAQDIQEHEGKISPRDRVSWNKFINLYLDSFTNKDEIRKFKKLPVKEQVEELNDWIETDPLQEWQYWFLGFRIPVNGMTAVQMYKLNGFIDSKTGDTAEFHSRAVLGDMQADWDGDTVTIKWMDQEETESLLEFTRQKNDDGTWGLSDLYEKVRNDPKLERFKMPERKDLSSPDAVMEGVYSSYKNNGAMGLIMNLISLRGVLESKNFEAIFQETAGDRRGEAFNINVIKSSDRVVLPFEMREEIIEENLNAGEKIVVGEDGAKYLETTSRNAMAIILQAALDDSKYGLLSSWGYAGGIPESGSATESGEGGIPFVMKQIFEKVYEDGTSDEMTNQDIWKLWKILAARNSKSYYGFRFSGLRNGMSKKGQEASMRQIMFESKLIHLQNELTNEQLGAYMKAHGNRGKLKSGSPKIVNISIVNNKTHFEELLSYPYEYFVERYGTDEYLSFLRLESKVQKNAHRMTMEVISDQIDTFRLPAEDGGIFQDGISAEDESIGYRFHKKLAKPFYEILDEGKTLNSGVQRDTSYSLAAYDYVEAFKNLIADNIEEFEKLTPPQRFVATTWFLQGEAGDYTEVPPDIRRQVAELSNDANFIQNLLKEYATQLASLRSKYKEQKRLIDGGKISDVEAKPTKTGRMDFDYLGEQASDVKSLNTFDAILNGERTATTRFQKLNYWGDLQVGDTILFSSKDGRNMLVRVNEDLKEVDFANMTDSEIKYWSKIEGWSIDKANKFAKQKKKGIQIKFELVDRTPPPGEVLYAALKIVSGMQSGADQGGAEAGKYDLGLQVGGRMPKGYRTLGEDGSNVYRPDFADEFNATEDESSSYPPRTKRNVDQSDGTLAFRFQPSAGTDRTVVYARTGKWEKGIIKSQDNGHRPVLVLTNFENTKINRRVIRRFIERNNISVLNVAGHSEKSYPGIQQGVRVLLNAALREDPKAITPLTNRLENIEREASRLKNVIKDKEIEYQEKVDEMAEYRNSVKDGQRAKKRYITKLLPFDLMSDDVVKIYGKEFGKQSPQATDAEPIQPFLISYKEFDNILNKKLKQQGKC